MARRASVMGGDTVLSATTRDVTAEQKEANEITSLSAEFRRMVLDKIKPNVVLLLGGYLPLFAMSIASAQWVDAHSAGGHYWFVIFLASLALAAQRSPWILNPRTRRWVYVSERDDLDKRAVMLSWAITAVLAAVLAIGGLLYLVQVGKCTGPFVGAMLNPTKMRLFNLTLTKLVDGDAASCEKYGWACNATASRCPQIGMWESNYVCNFCAAETHYCDVRRRGLPECAPCVGKAGAPPKACAASCDFCFTAAPITFNIVLGYYALTVGAAAIVLAARRFAHNWTLHAIVYDLKSIATERFPPPPPVPPKSLEGLLREERAKVHVEKPKKKKKKKNPDNRVGPMGVPRNPTTI